jgi:hypothetical protein
MPRGLDDGLGDDGTRHWIWQGVWVQRVTHLLTDHAVFLGIMTPVRRAVGDDKYEPRNEIG